MHASASPVRNEEMAPEGLERPADFLGKTASPENSAAKSGAVQAGSTSMPADLQSLAAALLALPQADRERLAAMLLGTATEK